MPTEISTIQEARGFLAEYFGGDAVDCGAVFEREGGEARLVEVGGGVADGVV